MLEIGNAADARNVGCNASGAAVADRPLLADADLARVVAAWPTLPPAVRAGVLAMVEASGR